ncbi:MAG: HEAT repeat domain-containing protein [Candidatus Edwardsbacteria bacterium]
MKRYLNLFMISLFLFTSQSFAENARDVIGRLAKQETRQQAIAEIERLGSSAIPDLREVAKNKNQSEEMRVSCIVLLGRLKAAEAKVELEEYLLKDGNKFCREASAIALGNLGDETAIPKLKEALKDKSGNVRMRAVWALAKLGDKSGKELALETIKGKDVTAKLLAVEALEAIGDKSVISALKENLKSKNVWTKIHSKLAIKRIEAVGLSEAEKLGFLKETLSDEQFEVNQWAAQELGRMVIERSNNQAVAILKEVAKGEEVAGSYSATKVLQKLVEMGKIKEEEK